MNKLYLLSISLILLNPGFATDFQADSPSSIKENVALEKLDKEISSLLQEVAAEELKPSVEKESVKKNPETVVATPPDSQETSEKIANNTELEHREEPNKEISLQEAAIPPESQAKSEKIANNTELEHREEPNKEISLQEAAIPPESQAKSEETANAERRERPKVSLQPTEAARTPQAQAEAVTPAEKAPQAQAEAVKPAEKKEQSPTLSQSPSAELAPQAQTEAAKPSQTNPNQPQARRPSQLPQKKQSPSSQQKAQANPSNKAAPSKKAPNAKLKMQPKRQMTQKDPEQKANARTNPWDRLEAHTNQASTITEKQKNVALDSPQPPPPVRPPPKEIEAAQDDNGQDQMDNQSQPAMPSNPSCKPPRPQCAPKPPKPACAPKPQCAPKPPKPTCAPKPQCAPKPPKPACAPKPQCAPKPPKPACAPKPKCAPKPICPPKPKCAPKPKCCKPACITYNTAVRPLADNGIGMSVTGEALLWQAVEENLTYIMSGNTSNGATNFNLHTVDFNWDWGFRVGAAYNTRCDGWDIGLTWTHIRNTASDHQESHAPNNTLFQVWTDRANRLTTAQISDAKAHWKANLEQVDLELGREFYAGRCFTLRPFVGMRSTWLFQKYNVELEGFLGKNKADMSNRFWGYGFSGGFDTEWRVAYGVSIYGGADMALLLGFFDVDQKGTQNGSRIWSNDKSFRAGRAILDIDLGLKWFHLFCGDSFGLTLKAGYEYHLYFNQNQFLLPMGSLAFELRNPAAGDLIYQGVTGSVQLDF